MKQTFFTWSHGKLEPHPGSVVQEFPLQLIVNGREIATLIGSPHDLRFLVAGFLRLQGFVQSLSDFKMFSVCEDFGAANVQIKGELPERLKPVLTSGCGTGITFSMPDTATPSPFERESYGNRFTPDQIFTLMEELAKRADNYRTHGGIHSTAVGREGRLLLYSEDLGRHNTLDRIAGEALFKGIDLNETMLVTSGRVSTEMVAKAHLLGIRLIASRTSPTDMAIQLCEQSNICLAGYVRGSKFTIYSHPEMIDQHQESTRIAGITGVILAGGASRRMGSNKALLKIDGITLIERIYHVMSELFHNVLIVTNTPEDFAFLPCSTIPDSYPGVGSIAGLHAGLAASPTEHIFAVACDMPFLNPELIRLLCTVPHEGAVVPLNREGLREPLHALYDRSILAVLQQMIEKDDKCILDLLDKIGATQVTWERYQAITGAEESFRNVNTPEEYEALKES